ncbi:histidine kinase dimerization/phosphoacceptor domain -containing protein [Paracoccus aminophilus]|uniref:histidine kinase n=1 Tax=Paracoccus aminophilus JCM 7686 TaxID=1367847 RepID=S5Y446_PARAH|nr:histidine kinase dimerization/phosphoacceptor domain -containing protein [Paracoccus aminophilus]AGT10500.1 periplasmic sensor signal transduction histidine kinase [Paracoccus aminophilus JCM 7686]
MLSRIHERLEFTKGLGFRLGSLLSVAILPIGLISVIQTLHLSREYERSAEIALLGRTASAAAGERALLQGALGSADALGPAVLETLSNPTACSEIMARFIESTAIFAYAGFTTMKGQSACSSIGGSYDLSATQQFQAFSANPGTLVSSADNDPITGGSIVTVSQPLFRGDELLGYIAVAMSRDLLRSSHVGSYGTEGARILTFNNLGQVLSFDKDGDDDFDSILPAGKSLTSLLSRSETTFRDTANSGENRVFSVVPVVPGLVYALGSWNREQSGIAGIDLSRLAAMVLPIVLWLVSLIVAYFAVYRLVLRHIRELRGQMRRFAIGDRSVAPPVLVNAPAEIADVSHTFHNMARILMRDEEALEEAVQEKTVLLKEVHHRVKNNLQLIASIINMQSRLIDHDQARRVLRSVQDRVASLATIYRNLYQAEHLDAVEADRLISDIINQMVNASVEPGQGLQVETRLEPLTLLPDQAVPLSLLATEAFTNAIKYAGTFENGEKPWVRVTLGPDSRPNWAVIEVANSVPSVKDTRIEGTGLGSQLIEAFAMQLDGEAEIEHSADTYSLRLRFRVEAVPSRPVEGREQTVVLTSAARPGATH